MKLKALLLVTLLIQQMYSLNFPLTKSRETCLIITEGSYQLQYVVSGHSEKQIRFIVQQTSRVIIEITGKSQYEGEFVVSDDEASICFSALDNLAKSVSVDFFKTDDPLQGIIKDQQKLKIHEKLYKSYQQLQKVYRDQHFFLERTYIHSILLKQTQVVVVFFLLVKLVFAFICSFFQLYYVKQILENNFSPLSSEQPDWQQSNST